MANTHQIEPCLQGLACAALDPGLRSVLIEDCPPATLDALAMAWAKLLEAADGQPATCVSLSSSFTEDDLWGHPDLQALRADAPMPWRDGVLTQINTNTTPRIICIPNLAQQSLASERAAVVLIGAPAATLQRYGLDTTWKPNLCWLAACEHHRIGEVSPHLLDRLVLRLPAPTPTHLDRVAAIHALVQDAKSPQITWESLDMLIQQIHQAPTTRPTAPQTVLTAIHDLLGSEVGEGMRRSLTLARLACALAWLDGAAETTETHVRQAAALIGLKAPTLAPLSEPTPDALSQPGLPGAPTPSVDTPAHISEPTAPAVSVVEPMPGDDAVGGLPVGLPDQEEVLPMVSVKMLREPYPEDHAPVLRDRNALQIPLGHRQHHPGTRGVIIGTQSAHNMRDLALFETILEALKYRFLRTINAHAKGQLRFARNDLRTYRRAPQPDHLLVLVLDYTCLQGCNWEEALLPHLRWAYTTRATIGFIQVGARSAPHKLQARMLRARRLLDPHLNEAFREATQDLPGSATPLAHGLELATRLLRVALQHGRASANYARLVVLSDGRGNVPLAASHSGVLSGSVRREGINDALGVAAELRTIHRVMRVLLDPQPPQLADLPQILADALGASVEKVARRSRETHL